MTKRTKVLLLCSRGVRHEDRHLMLDMRKLIPHSKKDCKFDKKDSLTALNEIAGLGNCDKCLYFENRKGKIMLLWASNINGGPTVRFLVTGVHTMHDIKLIGNCLQGSRSVLSFDQHFDKIPHLQLIKELFIQIINVPYKHPKSQPFVDHVCTFTYFDGRIWFRNYQILDQTDMTMAEIGPRMCLMPLIILSSSFHGKVLWANFKRTAPKPSQPETANGKAANKKRKIQEPDSAEQSPDEDSDDDLDDIEKYQ